MREIVTGMARARFWLNEDSGAIFTPARFASGTANAAVALGDQAIGAAGIEVFIPRGGRAEYGLLGGRFEPSGTGGLTIRVAIAEGEGEIYKAALVERIDDVRVGLTPEYADAVLQGALEVSAEVRFRSGSMTFDRAAHGLVGSSPALFRNLAGVLVRALSSPSRPFAEEQVCADFDLIRSGRNVK